MKETFKTAEECLARIAEIDVIMGFPDNTGTVTYCNVPEPNENGEYEVIITNELDKLLNI